MADIEQQLRSAMHAAVDGEEAAAGELIKLVRRRHRRHTAWAGSVAVLAILAVAISAAIALHGRVFTSAPVSRAHHPAQQQLPAGLRGLPMPAGTDVQVLISDSSGAAWYSTATRRTEHIGGLPPSPGGYRFERLYGGWSAESTTISPPCPANPWCAGQPNQFYFIADGSLTATRIGAGYAQDGVAASSRPGAVWLATYPHATTSVLTGSATAQLVSTTGQPLGPRYRLPADYLLGSGVGSYLLLVSEAQQNLSILWDPRTGRVLRHFDNAIAAGPEQIAWSSGCRSCQVQILNVSTGQNATTPIPGGDPASLNGTFSDDGRLLAVQLPSRELAVFDTGTRTLTPIPGTALSSAESLQFNWREGGYRLIVTAGPNNQPGPLQLAYWQPGDARLKVATVRDSHEIYELETGAAGPLSGRL
jgi:hypothetical protein